MRFVSIYEHLTLYEMEYKAKIWLKKKADNIEEKY